MGWTSYHANYYDNRGNVDRKAECDAYFMESLNRGHYNVKKSAMRGRVYYAAVENLKRYAGKDDSGNAIYEDIPENERETWAAIFLTSVDSKDYYNFAYKDMSEDMGPYQYDCPASILDLLSPTENEYAIAWRKKCREKSKNGNAIGKLPIGSVIEFTFNGETYTLRKRAPAYQFKTPWWYCAEKNCYFHKKHIPANYRVVSAA